MRASEGGVREGEGSRAGVEMEGATGNTRSWCRVAATLFREVSVRGRSRSFHETCTEVRWRPVERGMQ